MDIRPAALATVLLAASAAAADGLSLAAFDRAVTALEVGAPTEREPLSMNATLVSAMPGVGDPVIAVLKLRMSPGWYIYETVPATQPFVETEWILEPDSTLDIVDDWAGPPGTHHNAIPGIRVHTADPEGTVFFRELEVVDAGDGTAAVELGLRYQICNSEYCLPPTTKTRTLSVRLAADETPE